MNEKDRLSDEERAQLEAMIKDILKMGQQPKRRPRISEKEELLATAFAMAELEKIREAFLSFQHSIGNLLMAEHVSPAIVDFADYCIELQQLFMNKSIEEEEDQDTKDLLKVGREALLTSIIETLKQKGRI